MRGEARRRRRRPAPSPSSSSDVPGRLSRAYLPISLLMFARPAVGRRDCPAFLPSGRPRVDVISSALVLELRRRRPPPRFDRRSSLMAIRESSSGNDDQSIDDVNGVYLDEETYLRAEDAMLRPDGSLDLNGPQDRLGGTEIPYAKIKDERYRSAVQGLFSPPPSYSYSESDGDDADERMLLQTARDIESGNIRQTTDPEALHQQVFAEEQTYLEQSEKFRKSLSHLYDDDEESPMARERREVIEEYNQQVLEDLMKEIDEMEEMAVSREEAMRLAEEERDKNAHTFCSGCGLRVTPDMIERAEMIEIAKNGEVKTKKGGAAASGGGILCPACYGQKFRTVDEAKVRTSGSFDPSSARMFDKKKSARPWSNDGIEGYRMRNLRSRGRDGKGSGGGIDGISTSSLFDMPKGYVVEGKQGRISPGTPLKSDGSPSNDGPGLKQRPPRAESRKASSTNEANRSPSSARSGGQRPRRRTSRTLGGKELSERMRRDSESSVGATEEQTTTALSRKIIKPQKVESLTPRGSDVPADAAARDDDRAKEKDGDRWVKVEDPVSKKIFFWNTDTGEMKKTLD